MRVLLAILFAAPVLAQPAEDAPTGTIAGVVIWDETGEPLPYANVYLPALDLGVAADEAGRFSVEVPLGTHDVRVSYVGFQTQTFTVAVDAGETVTLDPALETDGFIGCPTVCFDAPLLVRSPYQARVVSRMDEVGWCAPLPAGATYARAR